MWGGAIPLLWQMGPLHVDNCQLILKKRADLPLLTFHYLFVHTILLKFSKLNLNIKKHSYYIQLEMYCSKKVLIQLIILWEKRRFLFKVYKYLLCFGGPSNKQAGSVGVAAENLIFFRELGVILCILTLFEGTFTVKSFDKLREVKDKQIKILILFLNF